MKSLLKNKLFMTTLVADMLSNLGDVLFYLALMTYVISLPDAKLAISIISVSEMLPALLAVVVGSWADHTKQKLSMIFNTIIVRTLIYIVVGILMGFTPALWVVIAVSILNFFSDICGKYESGLFIPLSLKIVPNELREQSLAFRQTVSLTLDIVFRALSALLVGIVSFQALAFINAGTFAVSGLILWTVRGALKRLTDTSEETEPEVAHTEETNENKRSLWQQLTYTFESFKEHPEIYQALIVIPFFNGVFSAVGPLFILYVATYSEFVVINSQTTMALLPIIITVSGIVGSTLALSAFRSMTMTRVLQYSSLLGVGMFVGFLYHNIIVVLVCVSLAIVLSSIASPKFSAAILNQLPQDSLATALNGVNTLLQLGMVVMTLLVSWLMTFLAADVVTIVCLVPAVLMVVYLYFPIKK